MSQLIKVGEAAIAMHSAWLARNSARNIERGLLRNFFAATGEWFDAKLCGDEDGGAEIIAARDARKLAQKELSRTRGRLRAEIAKVGKAAP